MFRVATAALLVLAAACGGDDQPLVDGPPPGTPDGPPADADGRDLLVRLNGLPGVTATEYSCAFDPAPTSRCFDLSFTQPVDHTQPGGATFQEEVTLLHRGFGRPMIALTTGYWNFYGDYPGELAQILSGNQIVIEHRFFAGSRPATGTDWSTLTIEQAAADEHEIIVRLKQIYGDSKWVTTGASKGGMTATYHRRFYPDDVDASVPYVAPLSLAAGDERYATFLDTIGPPACRQALRDVIVELLRPVRFDAMLTRAQAQADQQGIPYTRIAIGPAVESAITGIEWAFWQYEGVQGCDGVPATTASDITLWSFLNGVSAPSDSSDDSLAAFDAYYFQAAYQLGYPDGGGDYTAGLTQYTDADYAGIYPPGVTVPAYTAASMQDIDQWIRTNGTRLLFIYGQWDPWSGGMYELGGATDSLRVIAPQRDHGASIASLTPGDQTAALAKLEAWTGVTPQLANLKSRAPAPPMPRLRVPPAVIRAWQLETR